ncbi:MAG: glutamate--tRNA ligase [Candidatus Nezhaarchaeota archaeon]|nr:glutamate--tRNA ligase [Candidatus Nezhaarchaeota archaeon]
MEGIAGVEEAVRKYALKNAVDHGGRAEVKAVVKKLLAELPSVKEKLRELMPSIVRVVEEVNALSLGEQQRLLEAKYPELLEKPSRPEAKALPPLPKAEGFSRVVTRFAPEPNGYLHLGHAKAAVLSHEYARLYRGSFVLRFEDTNPKQERPEFYEAIREDLLTLGLKWDVEKVVSDDLELMYRVAERLIEIDRAYACACPLKELRGRRRLGEECACRSQDPSKSLELFDKALQGSFREGEMVIRLKTSMRARNYAYRDPVILRIIDHPHPLKGTKYRVYPTYDFACAVEDHELGVSHILRSLEFEARVDIQGAIFEAMGWAKPVAIQFGRLNMEGAPLSKRKIAPLIRSGLVRGWDDPRLATLRGLWRRGIYPEAVKKLILDIGPSRANALITWELLSSYNRKVADPLANRYFYVPRPRLLVIRGAPEVAAVKVKLHPSFPERGWRELKIEAKGGVAEVYVDAQDLELLREGVFRLIGLFNVKIEEEDDGVAYAKYVGEELIDPKVQWVPARRYVKARLIKPQRLFKNGEVDVESLKIEDGVAEEACAMLRPGALVQFERVGFARIDSVSNGLVEAIFTHR